MRWLEATAPDKPAANANGTVSPSAIPMTMSRIVFEARKCRSICGGWGIGCATRVRCDKCNELDRMDTPATPRMRRCAGGSYPSSFLQRRFSRLHAFDPRDVSARVLLDEPLQSVILDRAHRPPVLRPDLVQSEPFHRVRSV